MSNYVLKYQNGAFVAEECGGYPYATKKLSSAIMFDDKAEAFVYLSILNHQFPNNKFDSVIYRIRVSPE